jgi:hypothetical protein
VSLTDEALDVQVELLRWFHSEPGVRYAQAECDLLTGGTFEAYRDGRGNPVGGGEFFRAILRQGAAYAVSSDVVAVIDAARETVPPFPLHATDLPTEDGFVWFEQAIVMCDDTPDAKPIVTHGLSWFTIRDMHGESGLVMLGWTNPTDPRDHAAQSWTGDDVLTAAGIRPPRGIWAMIIGIWHFDEEPQPSQAFRLLSTFLRFINEPWLSDETERPSRATGRRAAREQLDSPVRVIRLRRSGNHSEGGTGDSSVEWSHRWMVTGHWRNQWYATTGQHRPKWIPAHVKGPADKPLVVKETVFRVDR